MSTLVQPAAKTLPGRYYTDPENFKEELERFYCQSWTCAGRAEQVRATGDYILREVHGESIIITRDREQNIRAFYNVCRHRGTRIVTEREGNFSGRIQCGYHGWTYGLDGKLIGAPHMNDGGSFCREDYPLNKVQAAEWDGHVFINLDPGSEPLELQLADLPAKFSQWRMGDLRLHKRILYDVKANWKLIILNYNECLHCPVMHPALNRLTNYLGADNELPQRTYIGGTMGFNDGVETMSMDGKLRRDYLPGLNEDDRQKVCYYAILPNFLLSLHPDYMMTHTLWPRAVDRTEIICEWHFHPTEMSKPDFDANDAIEFWDLTNREDWRICELSQAGIQSRAYQPGPYSHREELLHAFDGIVLAREREDKKRGPARS
ncbi:MAG TPA: aromatic ring-hydroxylating dioxygenase subunit alpha [Terriglobales bacterium]|nr:aromatic ring-hydroxylating dioxygenase subunit alpha [Terriglobales bacterium]